MAEYVDDFLMELTEGDAPNFDGNAVVRLRVERYQTAMSTRNWPAVTALGSLLMELAEQHKTHPEYRNDWPS